MRADTIRHQFASDNTAAICPEAWKALEEANAQYAPSYAEDEWTAAVDRMEAAGYQSGPSLNPYWDRHGRTFEDPDGYRVVLQNAAWPPG